MDSMYEVLMQLPLFQGVSRTSISGIIEKTKFHFLKYKPGEVVVSRGEECTHLKFLISGSVRSEMVNKNGKIRVSEVLHAPNVLAPNHMFGHNTYYPADIYAVEDTGIMQLDKQTFVNILQSESIVLINLLNIISRRSQKSIETFLSLSSGSVKEKLAFWVLCFTQRRSTDIKVICKQKDLYSFFGVQRSVFVSALNELKDEGIIDYTTREIMILDRDRLKALLSEDTADEDVEE